MGLAATALRICNRMLVPTTGLHLIPDWKLHWQYPSENQVPAGAGHHRRTASRINVGCGLDIREGWLNVDARPVQPDGPAFLCCELLRIDQYIVPGSADEVLAQDILEHFSWRDLPSLLATLAGLLKPGGRLVVQSPDLDALLEGYTSGRLSHEEVQRLLFGDQTYPQNSHRNVWSKQEATRRLTAVGLVTESVETVGYNVRAASVKPLG